MEVERVDYILLQYFIYTIFYAFFAAISGFIHDNLYNVVVVVPFCQMCATSLSFWNVVEVKYTEYDA